TGMIVAEALYGLGGLGGQPGALRGSDLHRLAHEPTRTVRLRRSRALESAWKIVNSKIGYRSDSAIKAEIGIVRTNPIKGLELFQRLERPSGICEARDQTVVGHGKRRIEILCGT